MTLDEIKSLAEFLDRSTLNRISVKKDGFSVSLERMAQNAVFPAAESAVPQVTPPSRVLAEASESNGDEVIASPMVGTFYRSPSPDSPPFAQVGDNMAKGRPICILEAMKIFNEVEAEFNCTILEILVEDGQVVEYDTPLFRVKRG
ncbi:MAG: acetyl-CoA carboxylase biotin carboxyl carrier protein [Helicobacteraceae bacterium]|jgi:acetyl-CoA carboxylase biotin carboxyl carrier protein|nr:acetyl-CoA carboxylase biotin carboxyl carrier protein [Helicobacteraceae bacterium]